MLLIQTVNKLRYQNKLYVQFRDKEYFLVVFAVWSLVFPKGIKVFFYIDRLFPKKHFQVSVSSSAFTSFPYHRKHDNVSNKCDIDTEGVLLAAKMAKPKNFNAMV